MNFQRRTALLLLAFFGGKNPNLSTVRGASSALQRRRPPHLLHPAGSAAALSTLPSFTSQMSAVAASSHGPITTTVSRCAPETALGRHVFEVAGYSLHKGVGVGKFIQSATFSVGGYDWCIRYYPDGSSYDGYFQEYFEEDDEDDDEYVDEGHVSAFVVLVTENAEVRALCNLSLVNPATFPSPAVCSSKKKPRIFNGEDSSWGYEKFKRRCDLEKSQYLRNDCLQIQCDITVITGTPVTQSNTIHDVPVPPSELLADFRKFVDVLKRTDITFKVKGEVFHAHKFVLAMWTPVIVAELYGPEGENEQQCITIEDIEPCVFKALLHFIYTDSLPAMDGLGGDEKEELVKSLLAAADRCRMERMKLMCESILCKRLHVDNVAATLALAEQHNCSRLKDVCIRFIVSLGRIQDVVSTQGYEDLKKSCPAVIVDMWEKSAMSCRI